MSVKIKTSGKIVILLLVVGAVIGGKVLWWDKRPQTAKESTSIGKIMLPDAPDASLSGNATMLGIPSTEPSVNGGTKISWKIMAWNSQFPLMYANGGAMTTKGSLMDKS